MGTGCLFQFKYCVHEHLSSVRYTCKFDCVHLEREISSIYNGLCEWTNGIS